MLRIAAKSDFRNVYSLLLQSFPPDELRPFENHLALFDEPRYRLYVTDDLQAVISVWQFPEFAFIEHFTVAPQRRNQGLGAKLLQEVLAALPCRVCLEAELPETQLAKRRLDFYRRNGFFVNHFHYIQPSYGAGRSPIPMRLLTTGDALTQAEFTAIQATLYQYVYNQDTKTGGR